MTWVAEGLPARRHQPLPDNAVSHVRRSDTPLPVHKVHDGLGPLAVLQPHAAQHPARSKAETGRMSIGHARPLPGYPTTPALYPVSVRRVRLGGIGFLPIPPRDGHPCLALRFRSSRPAEDLYLLIHDMPGTQKGEIHLFDECPLCRGGWTPLTFSRRRPRLGSCAEATACRRIKCQQP